MTHPTKTKKTGEEINPSEGKSTRRQERQTILSDGAGPLLDWYDRQKRDLPWRRSRDPYFIWISEIMLQQTQVATAQPYFEAFVEAFPNVEALARAPLDKVLSRWSGLGYYRRARMLHAAARQLQEEGKELPTTSKELLELPGIGPYTAAAIASIAFGEHVAVLDGNVERVISRLIAFAEDPKTSAAKRKLTELALALVSESRPGDGNQALMELGATVCRPKAPKCLICPLSEICEGKSSPENFPRLKPRRKTQRVRVAVVLVQREDGRVLLFRRPENSELLPGIWELPNVALESRPENAGVLPDTLALIGGRLGEIYGGFWLLEPAKHSVKHSITHRSITFQIHLGALHSGGSSLDGPSGSDRSTVRQRCREAAWITAEQRQQFALSSAVQKILKKSLGWP